MFAGLALLLHPAAQLGATGFSVHPSTVIGILALAALYEWRARRGAGHAVSLWRRLSFVGGLLAMFLALNGPLHDLSDYSLFSAHMVQHLVLTMLVPPLLIAGTPGWMLRPALRVPAVRAAARWLTTPMRAFLIFNVTFAAWHLPVLYNLAMAHHGIHIAEHLLFMATAVLMWWPLMSQMPELPRLSYPGQMLYCFVMPIPMSIVAIWITMADHLLYPAYATAPRVWGILPLADQQTGGLIMWIPGGMVFYGVMSVVFFKWSARGVDDQAGAQVDWVAPETTVASGDPGNAAAGLN